MKLSAIHLALEVSQQILNIFIVPSVSDRKNVAGEGSGWADVEESIPRQGKET